MLKDPLQSLFHHNNFLKFQFQIQFFPEYNNQLQIKFDVIYLTNLNLLLIIIQKMKSQSLNRNVSSHHFQSQDEFEPEPNFQESGSSEEIKVPRIYKKQNPNVTGKWSDQENIRYVMFMDYFQQLFVSHQRRKLSKIFSIMAKYIPSRESDQCRSHHQKMIRKHKTSKKIVSFFKRQYQHYNQEFEKFAVEMKNYLDNELSTNEEPVKESMTVQTQTQPVLVFNSPQQMWCYLRNQMPNPYYAMQVNAQQSYMSYCFNK